MRILLMCLLSLVPLLSKGQSYPASTSGMVSIYPLIEMGVTTLQGDQVNFLSPEDYNSDIVINGQYNLYLGSNRPWLVSVRSSGQYFLASNGGSNNVPVSLISIRKNGVIPFSPLSTTPQTLMVSDNNNVINNNLVDLKVAPPWDFHGGTFNTTLIFTATHQ